MDAITSGVGMPEDHQGPPQLVVLVAHPQLLAPVLFRAVEYMVGGEQRFLGYSSKYVAIHAAVINKRKKKKGRVARKPPKEGKHQFEKHFESTVLILIFLPVSSTAPPFLSLHSTPSFPPPQLPYSVLTVISYFGG